MLQKTIYNKLFRLQSILFLCEFKLKHDVNSTIQY